MTNSGKAILLRLCKAVCVCVWVYCVSSCPTVFVHVCIMFIVIDPHEKKEDTLVLKLGSVSMAPQADNPLTRTVLRKDIYQ